MPSRRGASEAAAGRGTFDYVRDEDLACHAPAWLAGLALPADESLVHLDHAGQLVAAGNDHHIAVAVQHRPRGLVAAQS